jgi:hypothetical protein
MRTEIFIEGRRLDLSEDISMEFTYQIDDIREFATRETNFSKTIVLPGTSNNNKQFGYVFEFGSENFYESSQSNVGYNFNASKSAACIIYVDRVQIFQGSLRLLEMIVDNGVVEYEVSVFGELGGLVQAIGNTKLEQLDFSAYDTEWTVANIEASWEYATGVQVSGVTVTGYYPGSGLYFPLIDYGNLSVSKDDWDFRAMRPALYAKEIIDKIITTAGYTYDCDFFSSQLFRRLIIPNNQKSIRNFTSLGLRANADAATYTNVGNISWTEVNIGDFSLNAPDTIFTYNSATAFTGTLYVELQGEVLEAGTYLDIQVRKNGTAIYTHSNSPNVGDIISMVAELTNQVFNQNDTLSVYINTDIRGLGITLSEGYLTLTSSTPQYVTVGYGETIQINDTIPRGIFQVDFFSSIVKMFNLYVIESTSKDKHVTIVPYIDYYEDALELLITDDFTTLFLVDQTNALLLESSSVTSRDFTYKLDRSKPYRLKPMAELNGRYFEFKYKQDADYYNEQYFKKYSIGYGDRLEDTGYEFAKEKQTAEVVFAATPLVGYDGEDKVFSTIFKSNNGVEDTTEHVIRIMQAKKITDVNAWDIKNGGSTLESGLTYYGYAGHLDDPDVPQTDINFGAPNELYFELVSQYPSANLFNGFWSDYVAEITDKDSKLLSAYFKLTEMDIYGLNFARLIYLDGALWRLNRIIDYNPMVQDTTQVELLKVLQITYE